MFHLRIADESHYTPLFQLWFDRFSNFHFMFSAFSLNFPFVELSLAYIFSPFARCWACWASTQRNSDEVNSQLNVHAVIHLTTTTQANSSHSKMTKNDFRRFVNSNPKQWNELAGGVCVFIVARYRDSSNYHLHINTIYRKTLSLEFLNTILQQAGLNSDFGRVKRYFEFSNTFVFMSNVF